MAEENIWYSARSSSVEDDISSPLSGVASTDIYPSTSPEIRDKETPSMTTTYPSTSTELREEETPSVTTAYPSTSNEIREEETPSMTSFSGVTLSESSYSEIVEDIPERSDQGWAAEVPAQVTPERSSLPSVAEEITPATPDAPLSPTREIESFEVLPARNERILHHHQSRLLDLDYFVDMNPSWVETGFLAFQNFILVLGVTAMIPTLIVSGMGGSYEDTAQIIQTMVFLAGISTLLQTLFGTRLPTTVGGSFAFLAPVSYISMVTYQDEGEHRFKSTMQAVQGAMIVASIIQIILGYTRAWGIITRFFSPLSMAPVIALAGFSLFQQTFPAVGDCFEIGGPTFLFICATQYLQRVRLVRIFPILHRFPVLGDVPIFERFSVLSSIFAVWVFSAVLMATGVYRHTPIATQFSCRAEESHLISSTPWFKIPHLLPWGAPKFSAVNTMVMIPAVVVSMIESTATHVAASRLSGATPPPPYVLSRGIGWQGIGTLLNGLFGTCTGCTVSVENVGLIGLTRVGSRRVVQVSAGFMIFFGLFGKFGAIFASIPFPIYSALYCILYSFIGSLGLTFLQFTNRNSTRNIYIAGISLYLGVSVSNYFMPGPREDMGWFYIIVKTIFESAPAVAMIVAVFLDNTIEAQKSRNDRGMPYWDQFRRYGNDRRTATFYDLPFGLSSLFTRD